MILQSLAGLPAFLVYFCTALVAVVAYLFVYTRVTPHDEFQLIRDNDPAAAIALGLSLLGFVLPVVSAIAHSANVWDCLIWSVIALIVQIIVYYHRQDSGAEPVGADRGRRTRRRHLARVVLAGRGRAQRRLHDLLTMATKPSKPTREFGKRRPSVPRRSAAGPAGEAFRSRRAAADGHACGRRRRLCADADATIASGRRTCLALAAAKQRRMPAARVFVRQRPWRLRRSRRSSYYSGDSSSSHSVVRHIGFRFEPCHARRLRLVCARFWFFRRLSCTML